MKIPTLGVGLCLVLLTMTDGAEAAWQRARGTPYLAYSRCVSDDLCLAVACRPGRGLFLEIYSVENGKSTGDSISLQSGGRSIALTVPPRVNNDLYSWSLTEEMDAMLATSKSVTIVIDPASRWPISTSGYQAIRKRVGEACQKR